MFYLYLSEIMPIFAASKGEFAERMTTFMAFRGRFEPQPYEPSLFGADGFVLYGNLRDRDAILHQILIGSLEANSQFDVLMLHD